MQKDKEQYESFLEEAKKRFKNARVLSTYDDTTKIADYIIDNHCNWLDDDKLDDYIYNKEMLEHYDMSEDERADYEEKIALFENNIAFSVIDLHYVDDISIMYIGYDTVYFTIVDDDMIVVNENYFSHKFELVDDFIKFLKGQKTKNEWEIDLEEDDTHNDDEITVELVDDDYNSPYFFKME